MNEEDLKVLHACLAMLSERGDHMAGVEGFEKTLDLVEEAQHALALLQNRLTPAHKHVKCVCH